MQPRRDDSESLRPLVPPRRRLTLALAGSLVLHLVVISHLLLRPEPPVLSLAAGPVEFDVVHVPPPPPPPQVTSPKKAPSSPALTDKRPAASPTRRQVAAAPRPSAAPSAPEHEAAAAPAAIASDLPRRAPEITTSPSGSSGFIVPRDYSPDDGTGHAPAGTSRAPPETKEHEAAAVKQEIDNLVGDTVRAHRLASVGVDSAVVELGRSFERAAIGHDSDGQMEAWVKKAFDTYFAELKERSAPHRIEAPRSGGRDATWEEQKAAARSMLARSSATYAALIEVRQGADGRLVDLRLLASSGTQVFDARALGSVVQGLAASPSSPDAGGLGPGQLSLWELTGNQISDSALVRGAQQTLRYALLDVVPLKETVIELDHGGKTEQLKYAAHLVAVY